MDIINRRTITFVATDTALLKIISSLDCVLANLSKWMPEHTILAGARYQLWIWYSLIAERESFHSKTQPRGKKVVVSFCWYRYHRRTTPFGNPIQPYCGISNNFHFNDLFSPLFPPVTVESASVDTDTTGARHPLGIRYSLIVESPTTSTSTTCSVNYFVVCFFVDTDSAGARHPLGIRYSLIAELFPTNRTELM
jgi:hypothetical protein